MHFCENVWQTKNCECKTLHSSISQLTGVSFMSVRGVSRKLHCEEEEEEGVHDFVKG